MSVYIKVLAGSYDNQLPWSFLGTVTYDLLKQLEDNHHKRDITYNAGLNIPS